MYTAFYGLHEKPFSLSPNPRYLFFAQGHREALAHLRYGIEEGEGFIAVTGEVGTGKSTLCRALIESLGPATEVAFLFNPPRSATELLHAIAMEFGLQPAGHQRHALNDQLNRFLLERRQQGKRVLLIIDEAQNLDVHVLEEIRLLSNLETASSKLIQIILLGQPELDRKLDSTELRQLRQRISVRWFLTPLSREETEAYVVHRLEVAAGGPRPIFDPSALRELHKRSGGVPRRVNLLADRALLAGYGADARVLDASFIRRAAAEVDGIAAGPPRPWTNWRDRFERAPRVAVATALFLVAGFVGNEVAHTQWMASWLGNAAAPTVVIGPVSSRPDPAIELPALILDVEDVEGEAGSDGNAADEDLGDLRGIKSVGEGPVGSRGERLRNTLLPGSFLGRLLDHQSADLARHLATNAILDSFGFTTSNEAPYDDTAAIEHLEGWGLSVLRVGDATLDGLAALNHPVLLRLRTEQGGERTIALRGLGEETASLYGVTEGGMLDVSLTEIDHLWDGEAMIVWATLEAIPQDLSLGHEGEPVVWLQQALGELGLYSGQASGRFDAPTMRSVRILQSDAFIEPSGSVDAKTQMVLFSKLPRYTVPRLREEGGAG
ncbi:MAG: AAA family ATPase [Myxococcota bacterium]|jgi:general secretion pathway protein A|nr:AAA family ATPase [Myxococcota bacterium]